VSRQRGQVAPLAVALALLLVAGGAVLMHLARVGDTGGRGQTAADLAAISAVRVLAADPFADEASLRTAAERTAAANGARVTGLRRLADGGIPSGVEVTVEAVAAGEVPVAGRRSDAVSSTSRAGVTFSAALPGAGFRPVDLHGLTGRVAIVAAAAAQIGWPYVWGGESRAEGGFDCSGLVGYAYRAAGIPLPGRPTAASLWSMARPVPIGGLAPGDLVFKGTASGAPFHVGIYAGGGAVIVAPHTGARVRFEPLSAGGWDGFGSLAAAGPATVAAVPDAALDAARAFDVPAHVVASEVRLGLAADARTAARTLAAAMAAHQESLEAAVAAQLGGASAAALVLRDGSGPALGDGFAAEVRLLPRTAPDASGGAQFRSPLPAGPPAQVRAGASLGSRLGDAGGAVAEGAERVLTQVGERGSHVAPQAFAAVRNAGRLGLTAASAVLPGDQGDLAGMAGSAWDAAEAAADAVQLWGTDGLALGGLGLWAARFSLLGNAFGTFAYGWQAYTARSRRDRIGYGLQSAGSGLMAAGMVAGVVVGTAVPPVGLALIAVGATVVVAGYLYRHPSWVTSVLDAGGRALDLAWRVETAPVRAARSVISSIPTPW
jgi:cell wall-associated NlpC family hydrolase